MITYDKVKISSVRIDDDYYDGKKKKRIKFNKIVKKNMDLKMIFMMKIGN